MRLNFRPVLQLRNTLTAVSFKHRQPQGQRVPAQKKSAAKKPAPSTKPLWQKLFIKGGNVLLMNAPPGYAKVLAGSPTKVVTRAPTAADTVLLFVNDQSQLEASMPAVVKSLGPSSNLWVAYRKGDKSFHRDTLAKLMDTFGFTGVAMVAVDDTWSALRVKKT